MRLFIAAMYAGTLLLLFLALNLAGSGMMGWVGLAGFASHLGWQVAVLRREDAQQALKLFRSNRDSGRLLFAGLARHSTIGSPRLRVPAWPLAHETTHSWGGSSGKPASSPTG